MKRIDAFTYSVWLLLLLTASVVFCEVSVLAGLGMFLVLSGYPFQRLNFLLYLLVATAGVLFFEAILVFIFGKWIVFVPAKAIISGEINRLGEVLKWLIGSFPT